MTDRSQPDRKNLRRAKNAVRGAFNKPKAPYFNATNRYGKAKLSTVDLILGGFSKLAPEEAGEFQQWIEGFPSKAVHIYPTRPIRNPFDLVLQPVTIRLPLLIRIYLLSTFLEKSRDRLASFLDLADQFERAFLAGRFENAQAALDEVKATCGYSVWLIET
ncbi:MAG: hypothetical protein ACLPKB_03795 [Xanthobacteraceae bacterium]